MCHHVDEFVKAIEQKRGLIDIMPACRALEADIMCTMPSSHSSQQRTNHCSSWILFWKATWGNQGVGKGQTSDNYHQEWRESQIDATGK